MAQVLGFHKCLKCGAVEVSDLSTITCKNPPCSAAVMSKHFQIECMPLEGGDQEYRLNRALVELLNQFANQRCKITVEPLT